jgi:hypothetical protein
MQLEPRVVLKPMILYLHIARQKHSHPQMCSSEHAVVV